MKKGFSKVVLFYVFIFCISSNERQITVSSFHNMQSANDTIPVKIKLEKTVMKDMNILFITDTAMTTEEIKSVLGKGYGEIMQFVQQNQLQPLKFMAWYASTQPPWMVDIAVEVNTIPGNIAGRIRSKIQPGGEVLVARIWGPYDQVGHAYNAIQKWMIENNRNSKGAPFEVYINDPATVKDTSEIQTDVYQPLE